MEREGLQLEKGMEGMEVLLEDWQGMPEGELVGWVEERRLEG